MWEFISIIIPGYNERERIVSTLMNLSTFCGEHFPQYEIIFVDDGSSDETWSIVKGFGGCPFLRAIRLEKNRGKGYAVQQGMLTARGQYRFFTDGDLPYGTECFLRALKTFKNSGCDMVVGARDLPDAWNLARIKWIRRIYSVLFSLLVDTLLPVHIRDSQCGFKGFTARSAQQIFSNLTINGYAFDVEIFLLAQKWQISIKKIPVTLITNQYSKVRPTSDPIRMLIDVLKLASIHGAGRFDR